MTARQASRSGDTAIFYSPDVSNSLPPPLDIPITLVLNSVGMDMMNIPDSKREKNRSEYEVPLEFYKADLIQKLLIQDCLKRIDLSLDDVIIRRQDILNFSKLILFSVFYKQFRHEVFEMTVRSPLIKQWNRQHPRMQIDGTSDQNLMKMENLLSSRSSEVSLFHQTMINRLWCDHGDLFQGDEDHQKRMGMAGKLLRNIHPLTQILLLDYRNLEDVKILSQNILNRMALYLKRYSLPEFNALVLLEYLQCSERENLIAQYQKILESNGREVSEFPMNEHIRKELISRKISPRTRFSFIFESRNSRSRGHICRLRTMILSGEREVREINSILFHRKSAVRLKKCIKDYMEKECCADDAAFNPEILHYYMNHLEEECRKTGCSYSSFVNYSNDNSLSLTHMIFDC